MKKSNRNILLYLLFLVAIIEISGCRSVGRIEYSIVPRAPWPVNEYAKINKIGNATLSGQAFMKTRGGDVKLAAGSRVILNPVTSYSKQFVDIVIRGGNGLSKLEPETPDIRVYEYLKEEIADADGKFVFNNIADGEYYLYTSVIWEAPSRSGLIKQGGVLWKKIKIDSKKENKIILTR